MAKKIVSCTLKITQFRKIPFPTTVEGALQTQIADEVANIKDIILDGLGYPEEDKVLVEISDLKISTEE